MDSKLVLVTGSTRGLGLAIAKKLSESENYKIVCTGRKITSELTKLMKEYPETVFFKPYDFEDIKGIREFVKSINIAHGKIYGLVNNAAVGSDGLLLTQHNSDIHRVLTVNIEAPIILTKYVTRSMMLGRLGGRVVNIGSIIGSTGFSGLAAYGATKAAMEGFTRSFAREVGKLDITVNTVAPGYMCTDMTSGLQGEKLGSIVRRSPLGRLATTADVAHTVQFLMSADACSITGAVITVDAGSTA